LQPLEFLKFTPKTNCGECGYAACLAFAAAVTKGGENPGKCPYVDVSRLGDEFAMADRGKGALSGEAGLLDEKDMALVAYLKNKIREVDFAAIAPKLGCVWSGPETNILSFRYLGRDVTLSPAGIFVDDKEAEEPRDQILLYNYIFFGGGAVSGVWVGMESLPNSISKVRTLRVYCEERIAGYFCGKEALLRESAGKIDAVSRDHLEPGCSAAFKVAVLPRLPMVLLFWDEDREDGFPPRVKILYDQKVLEILDIESLVFATERLAECLEAVAGQLVVK
jgi:hypothetical protein